MSIQRVSTSLALAVAVLAPCRPVVAQITVRPIDAVPPVAVSPAFGLASGLASTQYKHLGIVFSDRGAAGPSIPTAIFDDLPLAWGGVNQSWIVDLISPVDGRFVVPGTLDPGLTDFVEVEVGFAAGGSLTLEIYALDGTLLAARLNGLDGFGPHGRTLIQLTRPTSDIASFRVHGLDSWGMNQIRFNNPVAAGNGPEVPEPGPVALLVGGASIFLLTLRKKHR